MTATVTETFLDALAASLQDDSFVRLSLSAHIGTDATLKKIEIRPVVIKRLPHLSFTYRHQTRDIVKNHLPDAALEILQELITRDFRAATLYTTAFDLLLENAAGRKPLLKRKPPTNTAPPQRAHDRPKERPLAARGQNYLYDLKITDAEGNVLKAAQDKYKQINKYIEILSGLLANFSPDTPLKIVDMGAGKGYLTFALYDYLTTANRAAEITGVEYRADLVKLCNEIAARSEFSKLQFVEGTIESYSAKDANVLIALHACDTATDDAIFKGITVGADLIVVAPCCHKQIRREMANGAPSPDLEFLLRHGTLMERQAEMVTDALRALLLEYCGYTTKVFEFISDAHTPKNVMIVATKTQQAAKDPAILEKIKAAKTTFGIAAHHLEKLLSL